jgi:drug/metabolite transporter (DMT)-like permease
MKWILVAVIVLGNTTGDLLNTTGMKRHGEIENFHPGHIAHLLHSLARNGFVVGGIAAMAVSFFSLMALLSIADLSFAIPATAGSYMVETLLARYLLGEHIVPLRWAGASLVAFGVMLLAL